MKQSSGAGHPSTTVITEIDPEPSSSVPTARILRPKDRWTTRQIALDQNDRVSYVDLTIKELKIYVMFFVIFFFCCSDLFSYETFVINKEVSSIFLDSSFGMNSNEFEFTSLNFDGIITMEHFWVYFHAVLCQKLYELPVGVPNSTDTRSHPNRFLFKPRARQVRVEEGHCEIRDQFKGMFKDCYAPYDIAYEDKSSFGPKDGTAWTYSDDSVTQGVPYSGKVAYYGAGGYYFDFPDQQFVARSFIKDDLEYNTWLDRKTRAVFVDFTIYISNINAVCVGKLIFEFPASGGIIPSSSFRTAKLYRYMVADSIITLIGMVLLIGFLIYYTIEELYEIEYFRWDYITLFWNVIDFCIVFFGWCIVGIIVLIAFKEPSSKLINETAEGNRLYEHLVARHETLVQLTAILFFLTCVKIIKYTDLNRPMTIIYLSVGKCSRIVVGYLWILIIAMVAFTVLGYCAFGAQVKEFSTMSDSFLSALRILMRDFDFQALEYADQTFTTFFFVTFACIVIFVLLSMLVAIVFHAYFEVDVEELLNGRKLYPCDRFWACMDRLRVFVNKGLRRIGFNGFEPRKPSSEQGGYITYQDAYKILKRCHFTDSEVEAILKKYGIEPQKRVHEDEARQMFRDVLQEPESKNKGAEMTPDQSDLEWLIKRVDLIENSMDAVHKKCDIVIARLDLIRAIHAEPNYAERAQDNNEND